MSNVNTLFYKMEYNEAQFNDEPLPKQLTELLKVNTNRKYETSLKSNRLGLDSIERAIVIDNIANAFQKEFKQLVYMEMKFRYFNAKDAEFSVKGLIENVHYHSGQTFSIGPHDNRIIGEGQVDHQCIKAEKYKLLSVLGRDIGNRLAAGWDICIIITNGQILPVVLFIEDIFHKLGYGQHIRLSKNVCYDETVEKSPMIVCNNADLQAASYSAIQAVWGFQGLMDWNVNTIYVQEEVFDHFVTLLKERLLNTKIPYDVSKPKLLGNFSEQFEELKAEVKKRGFEYWLSHQESDFSPMLVLKDRLIENNVIESRKYDIPFVNVLSFRHTSEAITLANNRSEYAAASVWTESISLANEISRKLQASTVWVNSHGLFRPEIFCEKLNTWFSSVHKIEECLSVKAFVSENTKAQKSWGSLSAETRRRQLQNIGFKLKNDSGKYIEETGLDKAVVEIWIRNLIEGKTIGNNSTCDSNNDIKSYREPIGVIGICVSNIAYAIAALSNGNVLLVDKERCETGFINMMITIGKCLPGIVKIVSDVNSSNIEIDKHLNMDCKDYGYLTTKVKDVWYNFEDSI